MKPSFFVPAALLSLVAACSGSTTEVPASSNVPITTASMDAIVATYCEKLSSCFGATFTRITLGDQANCRSRLGAEFSNTFKAEGVTVTDAQAQKCLAAAKSATCTQVLDNGVSDCMFKGTLDDGATCVSEAQCKSGTCYVDEKARCGKCAAAAAAGADCSSAKCGPGLMCAPNSKCVVRGVEGALCDNQSAPCGLGLTCFSGKCTKDLTKGAACSTKSPNVACSALDGLYCKPAMITDAMGTCESFSLATPGQACGVSLTPLDFALCVDQSQCIGAKGAQLGTCTAHLADGATCGTGSEPVDCAFPAKCREGKCAMLDTAQCK